ncbi:MAG: hypothetical protein GY805_02085 [Chloroflexi bacterium]|nr:hypothetical protein [Chloroflexota bacterium]
MMHKVGSDRSGRYLPFEFGDNGLSDDENLQLVGKTGSLMGTRAQTAVVWRGKPEENHGFAITVMTEGNPESELWNPDIRLFQKLKYPVFLKKPLANAKTS